MAELAPAAERGRTTIADKVVSRVASIAAAEMEAVVDTRSGWTKLVRKGLPHADAVVAGGTTRITVEVAATWPTPLSRLAAQVRDHVTSRVVDLTGTQVSRVDVTVADVVHLETAARRVV
ncbi:Asp23/Gls24 family envelope stress response protein [Aeromicrobium sp. Leaf350]|uniref:Asp23/Gls24 family envelope stress response protein n=1 Tax=Aeromicrobium sp. Leaf350 TaxID=2876565 RepID=UPI001E606E3D|nr:Asp23/Gls24 family envelope stress response protein [Aeromicrobium sp. Leaf350]